MKVVAIKRNRELHSGKINPNVILIVSVKLKIHMGYYNKGMTLHTPGINLMAFRPTTGKPKRTDFHPTTTKKEKRMLSVDPKPSGPHLH